MDIATIFGIAGGLGLIAAAILMGGSGLGGFLDIPGIMIVGGGTVSAMLVMFPFATVKNSIIVAKKAIRGKPQNPVRMIGQMVDLSKKVRKEGALSLQNFKSKDRFLNKAVALMVDGMDSGSIRGVLSSEISHIRERHQIGQTVFEQMGLLAPAFGMIGTLIGLVQMLKTLSDPSSIGPAMAVALLTTFYGAVFANLVAVPIAKKLELRSKEETEVLEIVMEGMVGIVRKENPSMIRDKLFAFLNPQAQTKFKK
ncbi:MAG: flagellar motor protein MotP [bacterium]|nr:MAG: flagellar motor protein MotP [bacterium]